MNNPDFWAPPQFKAWEFEFLANPLRIERQDLVQSPQLDATVIAHIHVTWAPSYIFMILGGGEGTGFKKNS